MNTNNKSNTQKDSDKKLNMVKKVLGIIFCVIILTLSCFIYASCKESTKSQSSMYETEQQQMAEMTEYLNGIDESVSSNMEHLAQAAVIQTNTEGTLNEVTGTLSNMETQITEVEKVLIDIVVENVNSATDSIKESVSETKTELSTQIETGNKDIQNMLLDTQNQIDEVEKTLSESITNNVSNSTTSIMNSLSASKTELNKNIEAAKEDINTILSDMNDENDNNFQQTYEKLNTLQDTLDTVRLNLNIYYKDLTELINELQKQNTEEHEEILAALLKAQEELNQYLENTFATLNLRLDEDMKNLMEELNGLHNQIITTQSELTSIMNIMEENDSERQQEVRDMFADTKNYLTFIEETFADAHSKLQDIIIKFKEMEAANHAETLSVLQVMESDMQETTENGFQNLTETMNSFETSLNSTLDTMQENIFSSFSSTNSKMESSFQNMNENIGNKFQSANENIDNKFSETNEKLENNFHTTNETLNQNFQDMQDSMTKNFADLNTTITTKNDEMVQNINNNVDEKVTNLTTTISNYNESNGDNLEELKNYLSEQLTQVFTSVSNGKASLASALLTKGIDLGKKDATFGEIYDGIMRSPAVDPSIAATADNISEGKGAWVNGELIIGNGADVEKAYRDGYAAGLEQSTLPNATIEYVYHEHTGDSSQYGGCYTVGTHIHTSSCAQHHHTGSSHAPLYSSGGGCYGASNIYYPNWLSGCPLDAWHETWTNGHCHGWCTNCGFMWDDDRNGRTACENTQYDYRCFIICGKQEGEYECDSCINHWSLGCGKTSDTIEKATIIFN